MRIDLVHTPDDALKVVRLALAAGLPGITINHSGDSGRGLQIDVAPVPGTFASEALAALVYVVAEINGITSEKLIESWRGRVNLPATVADEAVE
ncbi:hypothetical protein HC028_18515 [Planosporangium flavigriseum]|uniref:hypothetical protein n=1 Tax=Planosporangium flavigriseum TaxID=373681 RepID=UPI001438D329|nr:hypothetical protein [Planosporangium flavigriseum]NJC66482.1 hypothetical protein [Planosporangium flavigriseum]